MVSLRFALLGVVPLVPPHHEVGGLSAERRYNDRQCKNDASTAHGTTSLINQRGHYARTRMSPAMGRYSQNASEMRLAPTASSLTAHVALIARSDGSAMSEPTRAVTTAEESGYDARREPA